MFIFKHAFSSCLYSSTCARSFTKSTWSNIYLVNIKCLFLFVPDLYSWFCVITWVATWKFSFGPTFSSKRLGPTVVPKHRLEITTTHSIVTQKSSSHLLMFLIMHKYIPCSQILPVFFLSWALLQVHHFFKHFVCYGLARDSGWCNPGQLWSKTFLWVSIFWIPWAKATSLITVYSWTFNCFFKLYPRQERNNFARILPMPL